MEAVLRGEGLGFGHVVRQWAYVEGVLDVHADLRAECQGYQAFNDVRAQAYARTEFPAGYPAATGIGQAAGGVVLEFVALDAPGATVVPLSNPRQTDAHRYSAGLLVGESIATRTAPCTPRFERGKRVIRGGEEILLVSGTAAIVGERSVGAGDVAAQTATTIENIRAIVGACGLSQLRAYVKRPGDVAVVRRLCEEAFGRIPALYVRADVCRDELLVEIEGAVVTQGGPACA
jgi:enamine deaminase RidA (YjgF/YER057c/UK114 family)